MHIGTTLTQYIIEREKDHPAARGEFTSLINDVAIACKKISDLVRHGELAGVLGAAGEQNVQGEDQKKLDVISNEIFIESTQYGGHLAGMASEEMDHHFPIPEQYRKGDYLLTFDPLDGSSNIDINGSTGTIFSITRAPSGPVTDSSFLVPGREQVCAGYCLYSSATMLVITLGGSVSGFTLDARIGEFLLTHPHMRIPRSTSEYAINSAYAAAWHAPMRRYVEECQAGVEGPRGKKFNMRWSGAMVGDVHRVLSRGGVFLYPSDRNTEASGKFGKLRLLYEANPMGLLIEQAGGIAHTGSERILDIEPQSLHQRVPVLLGSAEEIERIVSYHQQAA